LFAHNVTEKSKSHSNVGFVGVWFFYLRENESSRQPLLAGLSTIAGIVINAVSGLFLYMHNKIQLRSLYYFGQVTRIQFVGLAIHLAGSHQAQQDQTSSKNKVIEELLAVVKGSAIHDSLEIQKESG